jgi:hypothetical protein
MYDRNQGVKSITDELKEYGNDGEGGPRFNVLTGKITHNQKGPLKTYDWWYLTKFFYPVFNALNKNEYVGVITPTGRFFKKESFNAWHFT